MMNKNRLKQIQEHFDYSIIRNMVLTEKDRSLLNEMYQEIEHLHELLKDNLGEYMKLQQEHEKTKMATLQLLQGTQAASLAALVQNI